ncbi:ribonucleoside-triphosphate reductase, adenosylcobalamin-dependent [Scytonema hofmannii PCC 7110]|uniref:Ribonucleoside-triphosphate reductase, adenosylcobalamin-dependent n=1 Tax=Scytonema hofmannii PCC 7110 TaxID=128403 RepID=A0A139X4U1_9CYAN|nr:ribonucleoside-triphosphate reductase, adenosylcobalamin-dependent [Scytonema hofmannii]KYC39708.1 ribonucleoside-triphosphate reductase, adenosylcobalamin-dependent [Scytonema hofmannii PCC 7110]
MVRELERERLKSTTFPETAPAANPVFFRTYSRRKEAGVRETWEQVCDRTLSGLIELGQLLPEEAEILSRMQRNLKALPSGRWLWVGGTDWLLQQKNFSGAYNCTSTNAVDWSAFGLMMDLAMMGCGTGAVLEPKYINQLPPIRNRLIVKVQGEIGSTRTEQRREETEVKIEGNLVTIYVGDSRQGWVQSYQRLLELSTNERFTQEVQVIVDISDVRKAGEPLNGFGGVANPVKLPGLYERCALILNKAVGRQLNSVECCLLIDEAAVTIVAGNIRRSAGIRQGSGDDRLFADAKSNLWQQDENGNWRIDPERDALRMANHSRVFHYKPTLEECIDAVRKQYYSGEGAIQWAGEAVARANCDLLKSHEQKVDFLKAYAQGKAEAWLQQRYPIDVNELEHRLARFGLNPCGEIIGSNFHCVSGETLLITRDGMHKIKEIVGSEVEIWNGQKWSQVIPLKTGSDRKLYRVRFGDGSYIDVTEYHRFFVKDRFDKVYQEVQTKDLMDTSPYTIHTEPFTIQYEDGLNIDPEYAYTLGIAVGDGTTDRNNNPKVRLYEKKSALPVAGSKSSERIYSYLPTFIDVTDLGFSGEFLKSLKTNPESLNVIASWSRPAILNFIAGLADTDGSNTKSNGIRIYISDYERAYRVQLLLTKCGIRSSLNLCAYKGAITNYGIRSQDLYYLQITDCGIIPCHRLNVSKGTKAKYKGKWQVVKSVEELPGLHNTYCFNEPECHKGVFGNTLTGNCNLAEVHLNQIAPLNYKEQEEAFTAGALSVASLLHHKFLEPRYQYSRELDPIVGVSFTGLFDFFVHAFGVDWLRWWAEGRPETTQGLAFKGQEQKYLSFWKDTVHGVVWDYCDRHGLKRPNRCTTVQPSGTKSLLTGASPGWHPPKAQRFLRRITFGKNDPVALACIDYGYNVIPSQSDKDEQGNLLNDPFDPRVSEWLVEIPVSVLWADLPGADEIDISQFSALAQTDFYMQVQKFYVTHNTSATIELRENEVEALGTRIYEAIRDDEGYMSAALLARFDDLQTFPRLPFEPISKEQYEQFMKQVEMRRKTDDFHGVLSNYDFGELMESGPAGCDSDKCMMPEQNNERG